MLLQAIFYLSLGKSTGYKAKLLLLISELKYSWNISTDTVLFISGIMEENFDDIWNSNSVASLQDKGNLVCERIPNRVTVVALLYFTKKYLSKIYRQRSEDEAIS